jgi:hypothetical protein
MRPPWFIRREYGYGEEDDALVLVIDPSEWASHARRVTREARTRLVEAWRPLNLSGPLTGPWLTLEQIFQSMMAKRYNEAMDAAILTGSGTGELQGIQTTGSVITDPGPRPPWYRRLRWKLAGLAYRRHPPGPILLQASDEVRDWKP